MSKQDNREDGSLMPAAGRQLAPLASANPLVSRGLADLAQGRLPNVSEVPPSDPKRALTYYEFGINYLLLDQLDNAIGAFDEAIRLDPNRVDAYLQRAHCWWVKDAYDKQMSDLDRAIQLDPNNAFAYRERGDAWDHIEEYDEAIKDYDEAIRLDSKGMSAYICRASAMCHNEDYASAIRDYEQAIRLSSSNQEAASVYNDLARLLATCPDTKMRDGKLAIQLGRLACELSRWRSRGYLATLASAYAEAGQFEQAAYYQEKVVDLEPLEFFKTAARERLDLYRQKVPFAHVINVWEQLRTKMGATEQGTRDYRDNYNNK